MAVYAISDLHLSFTSAPDVGVWQKVYEAKPMVIFGEHWRNHYQYLYENWQSTVQEQDSILLPGDLSWALKLEDAVHDFAFLGALNGKLYISKGNHDYWWNSLQKVKSALPANVQPLQHSAVLLEGKAVCATRGWLCPGAKDYDANGDDEKIYLRELIRLEMALKEAKALSEEILVMLHYRPVNDKLARSGFIDLMHDYGVQSCIYGHIHTENVTNTFTGEHWGIDFKLVSCDYLGFQPLKLWEG